MNDDSRCPELYIYTVEVDVGLGEAHAFMIGMELDADRSRAAIGEKVMRLVGHRFKPERLLKATVKIIPQFGSPAV